MKTGREQRRCPHSAWGRTLEFLSFTPTRDEYGAGIGRLGAGDARDLLRKMIA
jgi:hypothetical protein